MGGGLSLSEAMQFVNLTRKVEIGANCYCLTAAGKNIVLDCGMHPKADGEEALPNLDLLGEDAVDAVFLSHAHHDHLGSLPVLMRRQRRASVLMTDATRRLSDIMLHNSVNVMCKKREDDGVTAYPLFTHRDVESGAKRWQSCPLRHPCSLEGERLRLGEKEDVTFELFEAGHILGSAGVLIRAEGKAVFYSGDVNFEDQSISRAARFPEEPVDVMIIETTRGDRATPPGFTREAEEARFAQALRTRLERGAAVLIPLFALGKTQEMLAMLHKFRRKGRLPIVPVYIGGLSTKLTEIYDKLASSSPRHQPELQLLHSVAPFVLAGRAAGETPIGRGKIYGLSSGMMTEKTLSNGFARRMLGSPEQALFFVGYADPDSPAGKIKAARPGDKITLDPAFAPQELRCDVEEFNFSAHASRESILAYINRIAPKKIILVHGDPAAVEWFRQTLSQSLPGSEVICPEPGVRFEI